MAKTIFQNFELFPYTLKTDFEPKNDTTWGGKMDFWNKTLWSNQNRTHEETSGIHGTLL
jgi:hypothetical protein